MKKDTRGDCYVRRLPTLGGSPQRGPLEWRLALALLPVPEARRLMSENLLYSRLDLSTLQSSHAFQDRHS